MMFWPVPHYCHCKWHQEGARFRSENNVFHCRQNSNFLPALHSGNTNCPSGRSKGSLQKGFHTLSLSLMNSIMHTMANARANICNFEISTSGENGVIWDLRAFAWLLPFLIASAWSAPADQPPFPAKITLTFYITNKAVKILLDEIWETFILVGTWKWDCDWIR